MNIRMPYASGKGCGFTVSEKVLCKLSVLDCVYIVPDNFDFGYTFSVNTFQQAFNRKIADFGMICTPNAISNFDILFIITEKSENFCGKVFTLDEQYSMNFEIFRKRLFYAVSVPFPVART